MYVDASKRVYARARARVCMFVRVCLCMYVRVFVCVLVYAPASVRACVSVRAFAYGPMVPLETKEGTEP